MILKEGELINNRYRLLAFCGSGSFGEVWQARDEWTDLDVALKVYVSLDQRGIEEFKSEYKTTFSLNHPNLLCITHLDFLGQRPFLVMPYCPSGSDSLIGNITEDEAWRFIRDVSSGLAYLHSKSIIHRDIKPDNILRNGQGDFLISDFGITLKMRSTLRKASIRSINNSRDTAGSVSYMGPELFSGDPTPVMATDIWALGATLYELLEGDLPFFGQGGSLLLKGAENIVIPGDWSETLKATVSACLSRDTWERPKAEELASFSRNHLNGSFAKASWETNWQQLKQELERKKKEEQERRERAEALRKEEERKKDLAEQKAEEEKQKRIEAEKAAEKERKHLEEEKRRLEEEMNLLKAERLKQEELAKNKEEAEQALKKEEERKKVLAEQRAEEERQKRIEAEKVAEKERLQFEEEKRRLEDEMILLKAERRKQEELLKKKEDEELKSRKEEEKRRAEENRLACEIAEKERLERVKEKRALEDERARIEKEKRQIEKDKNLLKEAKRKQEAKAECIAAQVNPERGSLMRKLLGYIAGALLGILAILFFILPIIRDSGRNKDKGAETTIIEGPGDKPKDIDTVDVQVKEDTGEVGKEPGSTQSPEPPKPVIPVTGLSLDKTDITLTVGEKVKLNAIVTPNNATNKACRWKSDNPAIATVSNNGLVTAKSEAITYVSATVNGITKLCRVNVESAEATRQKDADSAVEEAVGKGDWDAVYNFAINNNEKARVAWANHFYPIAKSNLNGGLDKQMISHNIAMKLNDLKFKDKARELVNSLDKYQFYSFSDVKKPSL